jgi:hypothetical protein
MFQAGHAKKQRPFFRAHYNVKKAKSKLEKNKPEKRRALQAKTFANLRRISQIRA